MRTVMGDEDWHITTHIDHQDFQIADAIKNGGAGDMGMMFGFATRNPLPIQQCRDIAAELDLVPGLLPDGKIQLTGESGPAVICVQHVIGFSLDELRRTLKLDRKLYLRGFVAGGVWYDTGVTGRKTQSDTYGGACPHGGGAFSGKDPTKVDRSAAYAARYVAKNLLRRLGCDTVLVQVAYALGYEDPVDVQVIADGVSVDVDTKFDWRPLAIIEKLGLRAPIYYDLARNGHLFRESLPWEKLD